MIRFSSLAGTLATLTTLLTGPVHAQSEFAKPPAVVPHEEFAHAYLAARGMTPDDDPEFIDLEDVIAAEYVRLDVGLYDLRFPIEDLAEEPSALDLREIVLALLRSQELFHEWVEPATGAAKQAHSDIKTLRGWVEDWKPSRMSKAAEDTDRDFVHGMAPKDDVLEAVTRFATWMRTGGPVGIERAEPKASRMMLMPTRPRFLEFVCFAGWYFPHLRDVFWDKGLGTWLGCRVQKTQVIALQFASPDISEADFELGLPLNYKFPTVMQQHAVHFGTQALFDNYFDDAMPGFLSTGLATNMVLEQFGEVDTRIEGDLRARFTSAFSVFVPGGNSGGGSLPPMNPDGRWRQEKGRGHFIGLLRTAQREGGDHVRRAKEKTLHFEIQDDDYRERMSVVAPFLGSSADDKELPAKEFVGDYQEFFRAYKSGFAWWLQSAAAGSSKACERTFAELFVGLARTDEGGFEDLVREVYGAALSEPEPGRGSLEGKFLAWLTKQ
jgi:hypothetical protein